MARTRLALLVLVLAASQARAADQAWTLGQWKGNVQLSYTGTYSSRFADNGGRDHTVPLHGKYQTNQFTGTGTLGILDRVDLQASLSGALQYFHDDRRADRTDDLDLDSAGAGCKIMFVDYDPIALAAQVDCLVPVSVHPRHLFGASSVDTTLKLDFSVQPAEPITISLYGGVTIRTAGAANLAVCGVELNVRPVPWFTAYVPIDFGTPIDRGDGKTQFGPDLIEHRPTTLQTGLGLSFRLWKGEEPAKEDAGEPNALLLDLAFFQTVWARNALLPTAWSLSLTFTF